MEEGDELKSPRARLEIVKQGIMTSTVEQKIQSMENLISLTSELSGQDTVEAARLMLFPLYQNHRSSFRCCILKKLEQLIKKSSNSNKKFVIGGLLMELDVVSKSFQSSCGSRMAQESSIFWMKIAIILVEVEPTIFEGETLGKFVAITARLANAGFRGKQAPSVERRYEAKLSNFLKNNLIRKHVISLADSTENEGALILICHIIQCDGDAALRTKAAKILEKMVTDKKPSQRYQIYSLEYASRCLNDELFKSLIPILEKQMLRAAELGCPRVSAIICGACEHLDVSLHVRALTTMLVKVILGTNEENTNVATNAIKIMFSSCKSSEQLNKVVDYLKAVFNGKEGKITQNQQKICILKLFAYLGNFAVNDSALSKNCTNALISIAEKESSESVLTVLFNSLRQCVRPGEEELINALFQAALKQYMITNSPCLFGFASVLYELEPEVTNEQIKYIKGAIDKLDKNPLGGASLLKLLAYISKTKEASKTYLQEYLKNPKSLIYVPKVLKSIVSNITGLGELSTFCVHCINHYELTSQGRNTLLGVISKQIISRNRNEIFYSELKKIRNGKLFTNLGSLFYEDVKAGLGGDQKTIGGVKIIVNFAIVTGEVNIAADLIKCISVEPFNSTLWRKHVIEKLPEVEKTLRCRYDEELDIEGTFLSDEFCYELATVCSYSESLCSHVLKIIKCEIFSESSKYQTISKTDVDISLHDPKELWNTLIIQKHMKRLDKNSKNYEEEKWAMEQQAKLDAKKGIVNYTKEQIEAKKKEMEKEAGIREKHLGLITKFSNGIKVLHKIIQEQQKLNHTKRSQIFYSHVSDLVEQFFKLLGCVLFDSDALNMLRSLTVLLADGVATHSWCHGLVSFSARLSGSTTVEEKWKHEILDNGVQRLQFNAPGTKASEPLSIILAEFCCLSLETKATSTLETLWGIYKKLPPRQLCHIIKVLIHYLTNATDSNTIDVANDVMIAICANINSRGLNTMQTAVNLINGLESEAIECRSACLAALNKLQPQHGNDEETTKIEDYLAHRVYTSRHSDDRSLAKIAKTVMSNLDLFPSDDCISRLCEDAHCGLAHLQYQAAKAAAEYVRARPIDLEAEDYALPQDNYQNAANNAIDRLCDLYKEEYELSLPRVDSMGRQVKNIEDRFLCRLGISKTIHAILESISTEKAEQVFNLLIPLSLNDYTPSVAEEMLHVGMKAIDIHGTVLMPTILPLFEDYLQEGKSDSGADVARQAVVVLLGRLAKHLDVDDKRVKPIVGQLIAALSVPSEKVQKAVGLCLPALVPAIRNEVRQTVKGLIDLMLESNQYGERRGGAHGLAGIIKGLGLLSIKTLGIIDTLSAAMQDKKNTQKREGALFGLGAISNTLGRLFEPYVVTILPTLLEAVGDGNFGVREAAEEASHAVMRSLSAHGVKLVLPHLLKALESEQWRTKVGSVELLGSMAHCSPKQLSNCLPQIVPYLAEVLTDSHPKVGKAGRQALGQIGKVIQNPEIKQLTPFLLDGLADPSNKISPALVQLNSTRFVHHIDAASLALIMPIIQRSFNERSAETRKLAAQIIGGMCNRNQALCSGSDFTPYLINIMPGLRLTLVDPVPDVRATAAKAIGNIVSITPADDPVTSELLPWLKSLLISVSSAVDRSGAAQGLAEVLYAKGPKELERIMPQMLEEAGNISLPPTVRDGYCMAFIYFPVVFREAFSGFVSKVIPALLANLADENEYLRDTALKAGKKIIQLFADTAIALLLPELEQGLLDENWRIRYSSVQLLGDLLFHITGVSGKQSSEAGTGEDNFGTNEGQKMIQQRLGQLCYSRVLAGIYMCRSDVALLVRQSALHVWKLVVYNTARTIREVLPTLIQTILQNLASEYDEKRQIASRTLGDLVKKLGERILPKLMPILNKGLESDSEEQRQGVCIGLTEVIQSASKDMVIVMTQQLGPTIRSALSDVSEWVRRSAADAFEVLHNKLGVQAIEEIIPHLLDLLKASEDEKNRALDGLRRIMASKGRAVLPAVLPKLTEKPVNTATLAFLASAAGEHLSRYVDQVMSALIGSLVDNDCSVAVLEDCSILIEAVDDEHGASLLLNEIVQASKSEDAMTRQAAACLLRLFTAKTKANYEEYYGVLFRELIRLFAEPAGSPILEISWTALQQMVKQFDSEELQTHLTSVRQALSFIRKECDSQGHLPGFSLEKKGINCILPIFKEGILASNPDTKECTALCLQEVIAMTSPTALKPSVVGLAGPLIRVLGDRFGPQVKCPLLQTLELLLQRNGIALKAFLPQLQTTFLKATHDESREVRIRGAAALGKLAAHHLRLEPLVGELRKAMTDCPNVDMYETYAFALRLVIENGGRKVSNDSKSIIIELMMEKFEDSENQSRLCSAGVIAAATCCMDEPDEVISKLFTSGSAVAMATKLAVMGVIMKLKSELIVNNPALLTAVAVGCKYDEPAVIEGLIMLFTYLLVHYGVNSLPTQIPKSINKILQIKNNGLLISLANSISWSQNENDAANVELIPLVISGAGHGAMSVKNAFETCLVVCTRIRHHEYGIETLVNSLSGKDKSWLADFCQQGGKLRRLALTQPLINDPDKTLLTE